MTATCERPACTGQMVDGYCDVCGLAPADPSRRTTGLGRPPSPVTRGSDPQPCGRPGCDGKIEDGYCDVCGLAPSGPSSRTAGLGAGPTAGTSGSASSLGTATFRSGTGTATGQHTGAGSRRDRGHLGAGLVEIPAVPSRDPLSVVLADPEVPERKRTCARCGHPVGRNHEGRLARTEGFCPHCGAAYSFTPKLRPGDVVGGQYQVTGCIAHGGLGWIYLAQDLNLDGKWVVLKGLLDSNDESAKAAAIAERRFLIEVDHPDIVKIYNFVQHEDAGYIVMEYVGGASLREVRNRCRDETGAPLPVAQAIAYALEILPAFGYLHRRGLLYCDFKPDNVIQTHEQLKLIDLGGVRAIGDEDSDLYGTVGYQAPEVPEDGASISSDLYTVARTLAVLSLDLPGFQDEKRFATSLPPAREVPLFGRYESFHRFLKKATAADPAARFQTAAEMADQLLGVLREVVALDGGQPAPAPSAHFSAELGPATDAGAWPDLPVPSVDPFDPAAGLLATAALSSPDQVRSILESAPPSPELAYHLARSLIEEGDFAGAERQLETPEAGMSAWRVAWWRGVLHLAADRPRVAQTFFAVVAGELPGELAPKLALALALENAADRSGSSPPGGSTVPTGADDVDEAARLYDLVAATDPGFASASFGLCRVRLSRRDRDGAAAALARIAASSGAHQAAQTALCRLRCADMGGVPPGLSDLASAAAVLEHLKVEPSLRLPLLRDLLGQALRVLTDGRAAPDEHTVLVGTPFTEVDVRAALERTYRSLAKLAGTDGERFELVDLANAHRPRTLT
ncbi:MAG: tetratricopeptide repeat protein [Acidimicrobiales bacterium]